ncbi:hypothetical protein HQ531_06580 [bacterium]|nr:hypothetical protein [bacterium]
MKKHLYYLFLGLCFLPVIPLHAQLSPGPLAKVHSHLSGFTNCLNCHTWGSKDFNPKCLDCHTTIQARVEQELGYHGQLEEKDCAVCHSDHIGVDFQMIHWEPSQSKFDHNKTGYKLDGKHIDLKCRQCHSKDFVVQEDVLAYSKAIDNSEMLNSTFLGLDFECSSCHLDIHKKEFADLGCEQCHVTASWAEARASFDHDYKTTYPLRGAHKKVECEKCHTEKQSKVGNFQVAVYGGLKFDRCTACHADKHKDAFGHNCLQCHSEKTFKIDGSADVMNHNKTRYPLIGMHKEIACNKCHTKDNQYKDLNSFNECLDCHKDYHQGAFTGSNRDPACDKCHSVKGFFPTLFGVKEHDNTRFALDGAHLAQPCVFCHLDQQAPIYSWSTTTCVTCHESVHGKQFLKYQSEASWCKNCHKTSDWAQLSFEHGNTTFPLTGKHNDMACVFCHKADAGIIQYEILETSCRSCHNDVHGDQFQSQKCDQCHGTGAWNIPRFDHLNLTQFPLDGHHVELNCGACHKYVQAIGTIRFKPIKHRCQDCHKFEDSEN